MKPVAFAYWGLRRLARELSDDGYSDWKALATICFVEIFLIVAAISFMSVHLGPSFVAQIMHWKLYGAILIAAGVVGSNYYLLRFKDRWAQYEPEFRSYSQIKRALGYTAVAGAVILTLVLMFLSRHAFIAMARSVAP
jgi:hypothetical protein